MGIINGCCPSCGAGYQWNNVTNDYVCPYCGTHVAAQSLASDPAAPAGTKYIYSVAISEIIATQIDNLIKDNCKIQAIKIARDASGYGLKETKDFVEAHEPGQWAMAPSGNAPAPKPAVQPATPSVNANIAAPPVKETQGLKALLNKLFN